MEKRANDTLATLSVTTIRSVRQTVAGLSGGQRQSVAVAKAVMWNSKVVILDEPTAALGVAQTRQVLDLVKRLGEQGLAVVLISHNLHDIFEVADNITVLRLGQNVGEYKRTDVTQTQVVEAITAGKLSKVPGRRRGGDRMSTTAPAPVEGGPGAPAAAAVGPETLGRYARALVDRRQVRRARLAADRRRADHHRDRLPDAELELPDRRQLRQPHRPGGRVRDHRHGDRLRAAAGGDRPVGRLRQRRGGRARRPADLPRQPPRVRRRPGARARARSPASASACCTA